MLRKPRAGRSASYDTICAQRAGLAQLVERQFCKLDVAGSIPAAGTTAYASRNPLMIAEKSRPLAPAAANSS